MSHEFHDELVGEARADGETLQVLREHLEGLHGVLSSARRADIDGLRREFDVLHDEFEALHHQDMDHALDRSAHDSWRARVRRLTERVDRLVEGPARN